MTFLVTLDLGYDVTVVIAVKGQDSSSEGWYHSGYQLI